MLTDRLQRIITRIAEDNSRLLTIQDRIKHKTDFAASAKMSAIQKAVEERRAEKVVKDAQLIKFETKESELVDLRKTYGKQSQLRLHHTEVFTPRVFRKVK